jgi:hypothetical protein
MAGPKALPVPTLDGGPLADGPSPFDGATLFDDWLVQVEYDPVLRQLVDGDPETRELFPLGELDWKEREEAEGRVQAVVDKHTYGTFDAVPETPERRELPELAGDEWIPLRDVGVSAWREYERARARARWTPRSPSLLHALRPQRVRARARRRRETPTASCGSGRSASRDGPSRSDDDPDQDADRVARSRGQLGVQGGVA